MMKKETPRGIVYQHIKKQILTKALFPGNRIVEEDVVRETGVSRTSIRPALLQLQYEGLVEIVPNRGAFVAKPTKEDLLQVYRMRRVLECGALEEAMEKRTDAQLQAMERNLEAQSVLTQHYSRQEYVTLNHQFHWLMVQMTGNAYYEKYLNEIYNRINTFLFFYDNAVDNNSLTSHLMIYEALRDRDLAKGLAGIRLDVDIALDDLQATELTN
jgi:DNA-binding GntR family transcriptional regulator